MKNLKNIALLTLIGGLSLIIFACGEQQPGKDDPGTPALVKVDNAIVFKSSGSDEIKGNLKAWIEIGTYKQENDRIQVRSGADNDTITGWVNKSDLLFKVSSETDGIILRDTYIYRSDEPAYKNGKRISMGEPIKWLGYEYAYTDSDKKEILLRKIDIFGTIGWIIASYMVKDAHIGVVLAETDIYTLPSDKPANKYSVNKVYQSYKKFDLVPVLGEENDWYKVLLKYKNNDLWIKEGKKVVSFDSRDIDLAANAKSPYYTSKAIIDEINKAKDEGDPNMKKAYPDDTERQAKLKEKFMKLDGDEKVITELINNDSYAGSAFISDLEDHIKNIKQAKTELEIMLGGAGSISSELGSDDSAIDMDME
ncbi:MAG: hypothetical protein JW969_20935 [Spirochaetales bacterium]|nr:hypothetical protein [Spirochaetales bacterium]